MTDAVTWWPAPAKLNLFLHVLGRRADGYHRLQTLFQIVDLCDQICLRPRLDGRIERIDPLPGVPAESDLAVRAAGALRAACGVHCGVSIAIDKRIPIGAGLGGGSSDAATVLVALNEIWKTGLTVDALAQIGLGMGADVPVFVRGDTAWAEGIGDQLHKIHLSEGWYVIVYPNETVSTAEIFADPALTRNTPPTTIPRFLSGAATRNDLEAPVRQRYPAVAAASDWLGQFASARMSGSGSSVFAAIGSQQQAASIAARCPAQWQAFAVRGCAASPLQEAVRQWRLQQASAEQSQFDTTGTSPSR